MATDLATLQQYRDEAVAARHSVALGETVEVAMRDGRRMQYNQTNLAALQQYINRLDMEIDQAQAEAECRPRRRSLTFRYGG